MDYRDRIISAIAERECTRISRKVIRVLQSLDNWHPFANDIPLYNLWNEVCVQVQYVESAIWVSYMDILEETIDAEVEKADVVTLQAIWLQTDEGCRWVPGQDGEYIPIDKRDIAVHILHQYVLFEADGYSNTHIRKWLREYL